MKTIKEMVFYEFEEKKSKFLTHAFPINSKKEAENYINEIRSRYNDATHNCSAYKVFDNGQEYYKCDDDGEPSGTAGKPIGDIIKYMKLENVVIIVTRYFGGIKLGAGGLIRNYAKAAKNALQNAKIIDYTQKIRCIIEFSYDVLEKIDNFIKIENISILEKNFSDTIFYKIEIAENKIQELSIIQGLKIIILR